jgi:hypothetical protein
MKPGAREESRWKPGNRRDVFLVSVAPVARQRCRYKANANVVIACVHSNLAKYLKARDRRKVPQQKDHPAKNARRPARALTPRRPVVVVRMRKMSMELDTWNVGAFKLPSLHCYYGLISNTTPTFARPPKAVAP